MAVVSVEAVRSFVEYTRDNLMAKMDEEVNDVIDNFEKFKKEDILSSSAIDMVIAEINQKISKLKADFEEMGNKLNIDLSSTADNTQSNVTEMENTLGNDSN